jgi:hypothetical protein
VRTAGREAGRKEPRILLALALLLPGCAARAQDLAADGREWRGPIPIRNGRPYNQLALQFTPESADVPGAGKSSFGAQLDIFNNLLVPSPRGTVVLEDFEEQRLTLSWRKGIGHGAEIAIFAPIRYRDGGFLDPLMSVWHRLLGLRDRNRDNPLGRDAIGDFHSILRLTDRFGNNVVNEGNAFGPGDVSATFKRSLLRQTSRTGLAARFGIKLPTGNPGLVLGSGTFGAGLSLDGRYNLGPWWVVHANVERVWSGGATRVPSARSWVNGYVLAAEYRPNSRDSYVLQADGSSLVVETGNRRADQSQTTFTIGYERTLDRRTILYGSFSENGDWNNHHIAFLGNVGPDYTLTTGVKWRR